MEIVDYTGYLLAAHPLRQNSYLNQGVVFVVDHCTKQGAFGIQINKPLLTGITFAGIMSQLGFSIDQVDKETPLYHGGNENSNRIYVLHSSDWYSRTTVKYNSDVYLTNDLSVLFAISQGEGPKHFRAIAGGCQWSMNELEYQTMNLEMSSTNYNSWYYTVSNPELVFQSTGRNQWNTVLVNAGKLQINRWFS